MRAYCLMSFMGCDSQLVSNGRLEVQLCIVDQQKPPKVSGGLQAPRFVLEERATVLRRLQFLLFLTSGLFSWLRSRPLCARNAARELIKQQACFDVLK